MIGNNQINYLSASNMDSLTIIDYNNTHYAWVAGLSTLLLNNNPLLNTVICYGNTLTTLDINQTPSLEYLYCENNQLISLDISSNIALSHLDCGNNLLTSLDVSNNTALTYLMCDTNWIDCLDISGNTNLTNLECHNNLLIQLNTKNGNYNNLMVVAHNNNLPCVEVDNLGIAHNYWSFDFFTDILTSCAYITTCSNQIFGCTDPLATNYDATATVDDGSCTYTSVCANSSITGLFVSDLIHDRATFNFDNMNTYDANGNQVCRVDQIRIKYRPVGTNSWSQKNMAQPTGYDAVTGICNSTQNTAKITRNLLSSTTYEWQVKVWYCDGQNSGWEFGPNFNTLAECPNVGNLYAYGATPTKATFTWDNSNGAYSFVRLKARVDSISNPTGSDFFQIGGAGVSYGIYTKNKQNMVPGETYRGQARTYCDPNGGPYRSPSWSPLVYWTQPTLRIEDGEAITNLDIYPNPSKDVFNISFTSESIQDLRVRVLSIVGEELIVEDLQQFIGEYTKKVSLNENAKGIYFLEIETKDGIINKKLILQ